MPNLQLSSLNKLSHQVGNDCTFFREINSEGFFLANELKIVLCKIENLQYANTHTLHPHRETDKDTDIKREKGARTEKYVLFM
jgi:hypothetical protein